MEGWLMAGMARAVGSRPMSPYLAIPAISQVMQNVSEDQDRQPTARKIRPDHTFKYIMLISDKAGVFGLKIFDTKFRSICICESVYQFSPLFWPQLSFFKSFNFR